MPVRLIVDPGCGYPFPLSPSCVWGLRQAQACHHTIWSRVVTGAPEANQPTRPFLFPCCVPLASALFVRLAVAVAAAASAVAAASAAAAAVAGLAFVAAAVVVVVVAAAAVLFLSLRLFPPTLRYPSSTTAW